MYIDVDIVDHVDTKIIDTVGIANIVDIANNVDNIFLVDSEVMRNLKNVSRSPKWVWEMLAHLKIPTLRCLNLV